MRIEVDRQVCIGSGNCARALPEIFDQDDQGTVELLDPHPGEDRRPALTSVARRCPSGAIEVDQPPDGRTR